MQTEVKTVENGGARLLAAMKEHAKTRFRAKSDPVGKRQEGGNGQLMFVVMDVAKLRQTSDLRPAAQPTAVLHTVRGNGISHAARPDTQGLQSQCACEASHKPGGVGGCDLGGSRTDEN